MESILNFAHELVLKHINSNSICVDMTVGNGHDTLFLCNNSTFVYGFDIQQQAIENTYRLLNGHKLKNYLLYKTSHEFVLKTIHQKVDAFIYNLGYLPNGDKSKTTIFDTTYQSILGALKLLKVKGIIAIVVYPGHNEGKKESIQLNQLLKKLNQKYYDVIKYEFINQKNDPPYVLAIEKKLEEEI